MVADPIADFRAAFPNATLVDQQTGEVFGPDCAEPMKAKRAKRVNTNVTEAEFQAQVIGMAHAFGWLVAHFRPSLNQRGEWQTAVAADGAGFPDLVLCRERVLWVELKTDKGRVKPSQKDWHDALRAAVEEVYVWRPRDWEFIEEMLR